VHLVYMDDSGNDGKSRYQMVGGVIVQDTNFQTVEDYLEFLVEIHVPEDMRDSFEFHAKDLFHCNKPFENLRKEQTLELISRCIGGTSAMEIPIVYGAVDTHKLRASIHATSTPADVCFRLCVPEIEKWFVEKSPSELGILVCDDTTNQNLKRQFQSSFRAGRPKAKMKVLKNEDGSPVISDYSRGRYEHLHDDMYFGNSSTSDGLQLADICCFIIHRHLEGYEDTEELYKVIEPHIFSAKVE